MAKIGLYFGSFNPIHNGHIEVIKLVLNNDVKKVDSIWIIPTPQNPFKNQNNLADYKQRLHMVVMSTINIDNVYPSAIESEIPSPSYTINTLNLIKERYPNDTFYIIIGSDNYKTLSSWKNYEEIITNYDFFIIARNGENFSHMENKKFIFLEEISKISSTEIREKIANNKSIEDLVPKCVEQYIANEKLYK